MSIQSTRIGFVVTAMIAVPVVAVAMMVGGSEASAATCAQVAGKLASQNREVARILNRAPTCMKKNALGDVSLQRYSQTSWTQKCEAGKTSDYVAVASNRDKILRKCIPRGSHD